MSDSIAGGIGVLLARNLGVGGGVNGRMRAVEGEGEVRSSQRLGARCCYGWLCGGDRITGDYGWTWNKSTDSVTFYSGHKHNTAHLWFHLICLPALLYNNRAALSPANLPSVAHEDAHNAYQHPLLKILPCDLVVEHP